MKKALFVLLAIFAVAGFAMAQITTSNTDVLGAHLNFGRGCTGCHAPHSGAYGNGAAIRMSNYCINVFAVNFMEPVFQKVRVII